MATRKITTNQLKKIVKRVINESQLQNEYFEFNTDDEKSNSNQNDSGDIGFNEVFSCKNGMVWGTASKMFALRDQAKVALTGLKDIAVLMDGNKVKAVVRFDTENFGLITVAGPHNSPITDSDVSNCVIELGIKFGKMQAENLLRRSVNFWRT